MSLLSRIFGGGTDRSRMRPLYDQVVAMGRDPAWYRDGQVPDTVDGRFDVIAAVLAMVLLRLERESDAGCMTAATLLTETFVDDMDGSLRQIGIGDLVVGKHMGRMMGALGGRLGAFREAGDAATMRTAVARNVYHESPLSEAALDFTTDRLLRLSAGLDAAPVESLLAGKMPTL